MKLPQSLPTCVEIGSNTVLLCWLSSDVIATLTWISRKRFKNLPDAGRTDRRRCQIKPMEL